PGGGRGGETRTRTRTRRRKRRWLLPGRQPAVGNQELAEAGIVLGEGREPGSEQGAFPPGAGGIARRGELVAIELGADVAGRLGGEGIVGEQREGAGIVVEEFPDEVEG